MDPIPADGPRNVIEQYNEPVITFIDDGRVEELRYLRELPSPGHDDISDSHVANQTGVRVGLAAVWTITGEDRLDEGLKVRIELDCGQTTTAITENNTGSIYAITTGCGVGTLLATAQAFVATDDRTLLGLPASSWSGNLDLLDRYGLARPLAVTKRAVVK